MFVYKISDIVSALNDMTKNGFEYVSLNILEGDSDCPEDTLCIDAIVSANESEEDMIDSIILPDDYCLDL